jgi:hypothetical protein
VSRVGLVCVVHCEGAKSRSCCLATSNNVRQHFIRWQQDVSLEPLLQWAKLHAALASQEGRKKRVCGFSTLRHANSPGTRYACYLSRQLPFRPVAAVLWSTCSVSATVAMIQPSSTAGKAHDIHDSFRCTKRNHEIRKLLRVNDLRKFREKPVEQVNLTSHI